MTLTENLLSDDAARKLYEDAYREALKLVEAKQSRNKHEDFKAKYVDRPDLFVQECFEWREERGEGPTPYQIECLTRLVKHKRLAVRAMHGAGKSTMAAWAVLWFALTRSHDKYEDWKVATTAGSWRQLTKYLWPEIGKWRKRLKWEVIGLEPFDENKEALQQSLKFGNGEAMAIASSDPAMIEGCHADHLLFIYDESKAIKEETWDAVEGAFSTGNTQGTEVLCFAISTPAGEVGRFWEIHTHKEGLEDWSTYHINFDAAISCGRIDPEWAEQRRKQWGENSSLYRNRVLGEFSTADNEGIIPALWVELANERWEVWQEMLKEAGTGTPTAIGVDVGETGLIEPDKSTIAVSYDFIKVDKLKYVPREDIRTATMDLANTCAELGSALRAQIIIDANGIGVGAYNRLQELGIPSFPFFSQKRTDLKDSTGLMGFANWRSAGWWLLREMLDPNSGFNVCLPPDDILIRDLTATRQKNVGGPTIAVESKYDIKRRQDGKSTDAADAVIQAIVGPLLVDEAMMEDNREGYDYRYQNQYKIGNY